MVGNVLEWLNKSPELNFTAMLIQDLEFAVQKQTTQRSNKLKQRWKQNKRLIKSEQLLESIVATEGSRSCWIV